MAGGGEGDARVEMGEGPRHDTGQHGTERNGPYSPMGTVLLAGRWFRHGRKRMGSSCSGMFGSCMLTDFNRKLEQELPGEVGGVAGQLRIVREIVEMDFVLGNWPGAGGGANGEDKLGLKALGQFFRGTDWGLLHQRFQAEEVEVQIASVGTTKPLVTMIAVERLRGTQVAETQAAGEAGFGNTNVEDSFRAGDYI